MIGNSWIIPFFCAGIILNFVSLSGLIPAEFTKGFGLSRASSPVHFHRLQSHQMNWGQHGTILFSFADPVVGADAEWAKSALKLRAAVAMCFMGGGDAELKSTPVLNEGGLAVFPSPERAVHGIAAAVWRASYLKSRGLN